MTKGQREEKREREHQKGAIQNKTKIPVKMQKITNQ